MIKYLMGDIRWSLAMIEPRMGGAWRTLIVYQCMGIFLDIIWALSGVGVKLHG